MPWQLLQPLLGYPVVTCAISWTYTAWFVVMFGTLVWQAFFAPGGPLRMQYLLAFSFSWFLVGNILGGGLLVGRSLLFRISCTLPILTPPRWTYLRAVSRTLAACRLRDLGSPLELLCGDPRRQYRHLGDAEHACGRSVLTALVAWRTGGARHRLTIFATVIVIGSCPPRVALRGRCSRRRALAIMFWMVAGAVVNDSIGYLLKHSFRHQCRHQIKSGWPKGAQCRFRSKLLAQD